MSLPPDILSASLLPPNATEAERALEAALRIEIDLSAVPVMDDPAACPENLLPFIAWELAAPRWDALWTEAEKRTAASTAIAENKRRGSRGAVEAVLATFSPDLELVEWWQSNAGDAPGSFQIRARHGVVPFEEMTAGAIEAMQRDIAVAKPLSRPFKIVQYTDGDAGLAIAAVVRPLAIARFTGDAVEAAPLAANLLLTTDGDPLADHTGAFLEIN